MSGTKSDGGDWHASEDREGDCGGTKWRCPAGGMDADSDTAEEAPVSVDVLLAPLVDGAASLAGGVRSGSGWVGGACGPATDAEPLAPLVDGTGEGECELLRGRGADMEGGRGVGRGEGENACSQKRTRTTQTRTHTCIHAHASHRKALMRALKSAAQNT